MNRDTDVEIIARPVVYDGYGRIEEVHLRHRRHDGGWSRRIDREMMERGHVAAVMPYDPALDAVVLINQFRIGAWGGGEPDPWLLEAVAGIVEPGETFEAVARREAMEEAGCTLGALLPVCRYYASPGVLTERLHVYCGITDASGVGGIHGLDHEGEDIEALVTPLDDALADIDRGRIMDAKAIVALQWIAARRDVLRRRFGPGGRDDINEATKR